MRRARLPSWSLGLTLAGLLSCADGADGIDDEGPGVPASLHGPISDWPEHTPTTGGGQGPIVIGPSGPPNAGGSGGVGGAVGTVGGGSATGGGTAAGGT